MNHAFQPKKMFPAALLLEERRCLVVGGGRVAARKTSKLLEAGAKITVVAPSIREQIKAMDGLTLLERPFNETDLQDTFVVFAATDNPALNRQIIELCREKEILCSAADRSWSEGDLIMPASFSDDGLTVAVSTGGRACRRSRLLRESLSRHIEFLQDVDLFVVGGDAATLGFDALEKMKTRRADIEHILPCVQGVHEFMILDTCNRFEVFGLVSAHTNLELFLPGFPIAAKGFDAFHRLAEISAGLKSEIFGETRIVAQIKKALAVAQEKGWAGSFLQGWADQVLRISKEIRQAVEPHIPALEVEDLVIQCLQKAGKLFPDSGEKQQAATQLLIGRGKIGQGLLSKLGSAVQISGRDDCELRTHLPEADAVICATGNPDFVIGEAHRSLLKKGVLLIDLSLPRNIDPALPGVIDLSMLRAGASPEMAEKLLAQADEIIKSYTPEYERITRFEQRPE